MGTGPKAEGESAPARAGAWEGVSERQGEASAPGRVPIPAYKRLFACQKQN